MAEIQGREFQVNAVANSLLRERYIGRAPPMENCSQERWNALHKYFPTFVEQEANDEIWAQDI